jgi:hypothetical protein
MPSLTSQALTQANRDCKIRTVTGRARQDKGQGKCTDNREQKEVTGRVTSQLTNLIAVAVIAMPSLTSQAFTQANRDCKIRTVTGRARRDKGQGKCTDKKRVKVVTWIRETTIIQKTLTDRGEQDKGKYKSINNKAQKDWAE